MKITIDRNALKAVSRFAATKDIRYYLVGILIESTPLQTRLCATDGHTLAVHRSDAKGENEGSWTGILPLDAVNTLLKMKATHKSLKDEPITLTIEAAGEAGEHIRADWLGQSLIFRAVDGKFPDYRRVIPSTLDGQPAWINPDYLTRIVEAAKDIGIGAGFQFGFGGNSSSLAYIGQDMLAVVMPMRQDLTTDAIGASWARNALPEVTATVSPDVAAMIDPSGALQDAGLVTVSA
jgi:DNA polymerase-3 subunit beta